MDTESDSFSSDRRLFEGNVCCNSTSDIINADVAASADLCLPARSEHALQKAEKHSHRVSDIKAPHQAAKNNPGNPHVVSRKVSVSSVDCGFIDFDSDNDFKVPALKKKCPNAKRESRSSIDNCVDAPDLLDEVLAEADAALSRLREDGHQPVVTSLSEGSDSILESVFSEPARSMKFPVRRLHRDVQRKMKKTRTITLDNSVRPRSEFHNKDAHRSDFADFDDISVGRDRHICPRSSHFSTTCDDSHENGVVSNLIVPQTKEHARSVHRFDHVKSAAEVVSSSTNLLVSIKNEKMKQKFGPPSPNTFNSNGANSGANVSDCNDNDVDNVVRGVQTVRSKSHAATDFDFNVPQVMSSADNGASVTNEVQTTMAELSGVNVSSSNRCTNRRDRHVRADQYDNISSRSDVTAVDSFALVEDTDLLHSDHDVTKCPSSRRMFVESDDGSDTVRPARRKHLRRRLVVDSDDDKVDDSFRLRHLRQHLESLPTIEQDVDTVRHSNILPAGKRCRRSKRPGLFHVHESHLNPFPPAVRHQPSRRRLLSYINHSRHIDSSVQSSVDPGVRRRNGSHHSVNRKHANTDVTEYIEITSDEDDASSSTYLTDETGDIQEMLHMPRSLQYYGRHPCSRPRRPHLARSTVVTEHPVGSNIMEQEIILPQPLLQQHNGLDELQLLLESSTAEASMRTERRLFSNYAEHVPFSVDSFDVSQPASQPTSNLHRAESQEFNLSQVTSLQDRISHFSYYQWQIHVALRDGADVPPPPADYSGPAADNLVDHEVLAYLAYCRDNGVPVPTPRSARVHASFQRPVHNLGRRRWNWARIHLNRDCPVPSDSHSAGNRNRNPFELAHPWVFRIQREVDQLAAQATDIEAGEDIDQATRAHLLGSPDEVDVLGEQGSRAHSTARMGFVGPSNRMRASAQNVTTANDVEIPGEQSARTRGPPHTARMHTGYPAHSAFHTLRHRIFGSIMSTEDEGPNPLPSRRPARNPQRLRFHIALDDGEEYENILNLIGMGSRTRGLNHTDINKLPTQVFSRSDLDATEPVPECIICISEYADGDRIRILQCLHKFHAECIDKWLMENRSCPTCREQVCV